MAPKRIQIISPVHGKVTSEHKVSEPDIYWILERWLERHPEVSHRQQDIRIRRSRWTTEEGMRTEVISVSIVAGEGIADYQPEQDVDLYRYWLAEQRYWDAD